MILNTITVSGDDLNIGLSRGRVVIRDSATFIMLDPAHIFAAARALAEVGITDTAPTPPAAFATSA